MPEETIRMIRDLTNKGLVLGNDKFITQIETQLKRKIMPKPRGGDRKLSNTDPFDFATPLYIFRAQLL